MLRRPEAARPTGSSKRHGAFGGTGWTRNRAVARRHKSTKYRTCMTETKETTEKTLRGAAPRKPLSLKRTVESGHVRQSFSHGRSKSVVVEKKKKRTISGPGGVEAEEGAAPAEADRLLAEVMQRPGGLSTDELDARRRALEAEKERAEAEERERARLEALRPPPEPEPPKEEPAVAPPPAAAPQAEVVEKPAPEAPQPPAAEKPRAPEKAKPGEAPKRPEQVAKRGPRALEIEPEVEEDTRAKKKGA